MQSSFGYYKTLQLIKLDIVFKMYEFHWPMACISYEHNVARHILFTYIVNNYVYTNPILDQLSDLMLFC